MPQSLTLLAKEIKQNRIKKNLPVYDAGLGESPLPAPKSILQDIRNYCYHKEYTGVEGIDIMKIMLGNNIIVGNGEKPLIYILQLAFSHLYPKGTIFHVNPQWVSYKEHTDIIDNCQVVDIECNTDTWKITSENLENTLKKYEGPQLLLFNNPNNPSGVVYSITEIREFAKICEKYNTIVFSDDIYMDVIHDTYKETVTSFINVYKRVIYASSLSKGFACGGYRLGWLVFPESDLKELYEYCVTLSSSIYSCPSVMLQYVAAHALRYPPDIKKQITFQKKMFGNVAMYCSNKFNEMDIKCSDSKGAWYFLIDFSNYRDKLHEDRIYNSTDLCKRLIEDIGLITVSGSAFSVRKPYVLRYSYVDIQDINVEEETYNFNNMKEGLYQLKLWLLE